MCPEPNDPTNLNDTPAAAAPQPPPPRDLTEGIRVLVGMFRAWADACGLSNRVHWDDIEGHMVATVEIGRPRKKSHYDGPLMTVQVDEAHTFGPIVVHVDDSAKAENFVPGLFWGADPDEIFAKVQPYLCAHLANWLLACGKHDVDQSVDATTNSVAQGCGRLVAAIRSDPGFAAAMDFVRRLNDKYASRNAMSSAYLHPGSGISWALGAGLHIFGNPVEKLPPESPDWLPFLFGINMFDRDFEEFALERSTARAAPHPWNLKARDLANLVAGTPARRVPNKRKRR